MSELEIKPENYYLDVLQNPDYYLTKEKPIFKKVIKEAYSREQVLKLLEPQLTIPKSIAESDWMKHLILCSSITQFEFERYDFLDKEEEGFLKWVNTGKNENILYIYLASKRIGVDLVKVVEG